MKTHPHLIDISTKCAANCNFTRNTQSAVHRGAKLAACMGAGLLACAAFAVSASATDRGKLLYENHCRGCHLTSVHARKQYKSQNINDIRNWTARWSAELELGWKSDEIEDVTFYLNERYYKFVDRP